MTIWVVHCWALDVLGGEVISWHPTLDAAVYATLSWVEAEGYLLRPLRGVYSICEADYGDYLSGL